MMVHFQQLSNSYTLLQSNTLGKRALENPVYPPGKRIKITLPNKENRTLTKQADHPGLPIEVNRNQMKQIVQSAIGSNTDPLKADLDETERKVHQAVARGYRFVENNRKDKPLLRIKLDSGETVIFKGNPEGNRGRIETLVYDAAKCCQRGDLIVPVKEATWPSHSAKRGAMQIYLEPPRFFTLDSLSVFFVLFEVLCQS